MDIGKGVSNHNKFGFCISYPYLFIYCFKLKDLLLLCEKFFRKPIHPLLLVRLVSHIELSLGYVESLILAIYIHELFRESL